MERNPDETEARDRGAALLERSASTDREAPPRQQEPDGTFDAMVETAASLTEAAEKVKASVTAILANQMQTPIKNTAMAKKAAEKVWDKMAPKLDAVHQKTMAKIAELQASAMPPAPKNAMDSLLAAEVRAALLRMPAEERGKTVRADIDGDDDNFVSAALTGSPILTGLSKSEQAFHLGAWQRKRHGPTMDRIARLEDGQSQFDELSSMFMGFSLGLLADKRRGRRRRRGERAVGEGGNGRCLAKFALTRSGGVLRD